MKNNVLSSFRRFLYTVYSIQYTASAERSRGFTLIEAVVVLAVLGVLIGITVNTINPAKQLEKARDATRLHDISQIKVALDTYYNDTKCYPKSSQLQFGSSFKSADGNTIYMQQVPQDPSAGSGQAPGRTYTYTTKDGDNCPQWNVLYAVLEKPDTQKEICPLAKLTNRCVPSDFTSNWACQVSGDVDCTYLAGTSLGPTSPPITQAPTLAATPTPTVNLTPTPTPDPNTATYTITSFLTPTFSRADFMPENPSVGGTQAITAYISDPSPITSVSVKVTRDSFSKTYPMTFASGTTTDGTWTASFPVTTTYTNKYSASFIATDSANQSANVVISFK